MNGRCGHCGKPDVRLTWVMYQGRLIQVGSKCFERIQAAKRAKANPPITDTNRGDGNT